MKASSKAPFWDKFFLGFLVVWAAILFIYYFLLKNNFEFSFLSTLLSAFSHSDPHKLGVNWLNYLKHLTCVLAVLLVIWRIGRKIFLWLGLEESSSGLRFCLEAAFGIAGLNALWLGTGFNGLWIEPLLWILGLAFLGWSLWDLYANYGKFLTTGLHRAIRKWLFIPGKYFIWIGLLGFLGLALDLLQGITPDVFFDALVYHLSTLQFWMFHHGIADFYTNLYSYFPFNGELYFMSGFFFSGSEAAKLLNACTAGLCGLAGAAWVTKEAGAEKGWVVWAIILTLPVLSTTVWTTQIDVVLAFFLVLFLYSLIRWVREERGSNWALTAGFLSGFALSIKYTALIGILSSLLVLPFVFYKDLIKHKKAGEWLLLLAPMALWVAPWLLKNHVFTGNFIYPYLSSLFGGRVFPPENMKALLGDHEAVFNGNFSPFNWAQRILTVELNKTIAPLLFGFLPFLFWTRKRNGLTLYLLIASGIFLLFGFLVSYQLRLKIPAFVLCFIAMGFVLGDIQRKGAAFSWGIIVALFGILSLLSLGRLSVNYYRTPAMAAGVETREEYLEYGPQTKTYYELVPAVDSHVPEGARVLIVGDARSLYYSRPFYSNSVFDQQVLTQLVRQEKNGDRIWKRLREMGIDAIAVSGEEGNRLSLGSAFPVLEPFEGWKWDEFIQRWMDPIYLNRLDGIYRLRNSPAGVRQQVPDLFGFFYARLKGP